MKEKVRGREGGGVKVIFKNGNSIKFFFIRKSREGDGATVS